MAGLIDYAMMGLGVCGLYIGVKYGPQIISNMKGQAPAQTQQTPSNDTTSQQDSLDNAVSPQGGPSVPNSIVKQPPVQKHLIHGGHKISTAGNDTVPSGHDKTKPTNRPGHSHNFTPIKPNVHCVCMPDGTLGGPGCDAVGRDCSLAPGASKAYFGYTDSYNISVPGPQWKKSIPYSHVIASQGMVKGGKVRRALAANNHQFMPGGFVLSEASVRRGFNNVYSAGT